MTKTATTAIIAAILLAGGGSIYLIHQSNQQATARVEFLQAQKDAAYQATAGRHSPRPVAASPEAALIKTNAAELTTKTHTEILQQINRLTGMNPNGEMVDEAEALKPKLEALDAQKLKELIAEAKQMNDLHPEVIAYLLYLLLEKSPAEATLLGTELLMNATGFNEELSMTVGHAFEAWMKSDPVAADKWYLAAMASGALIPKSLPGAGSEEYWPERFLARRRFSALLKTDSEQAVAMVTSMVPADAADEVRKIGNSDLIARIAAQLPPEQQYAATEWQVGEIAEKDFKQAAEWVNALEVAESVRGNLLAHAASLAYNTEKLSQSEALEIINGLPETPQRDAARIQVGGK